MKKLSVFLCAMVLVFGVVGTANSGLQTIGTATYMGSDYNLIYEDDSIDGGLVWLDYTKDRSYHDYQKDWAEGLSFLDIDIHLIGYTTDIDWSSGWRLPLTQNQIEGYNQTGSELGHLYYESLGNVAYDEPGYGLQNTDEFTSLQLGNYWSGTPDPNNVYVKWGVSFQQFTSGFQSLHDRSSDLYAIAVRPGTVSAVPIPSAIWLLGSAFIGLVGFRKKFRKEA